MEKLIVTFKKDCELSFIEKTELLSDKLSAGARLKKISPRVWIVFTNDSKIDREEIGLIWGVASIENDQEVVPLDLYDETTAYTPKNDPLMKRQWGLDAIQVRSAWQWATGKGVAIAVIDSGLDGTHPEFGGNGDPRMTAMYGHAALLQFYKPVMDQIRTGNHPKILPGWNAIEFNDETFDLHRHGTAVASVAAAMQNNLGISGIAPGAKIAPYVALQPGGYGSSAWMMECLGKILETDIRIVNLSLATWAKSSAFEALLEEAREQGILVIAASGNNAQERLLYPAQYENVMSVGGTGRNHVLWNTPGQGTNWPNDIVAPAEVMPVALKWRGRYTDNQGTSLAAPHVAGVAALCLEIYPDIPVEQLEACLYLSGGREVPDAKWGWGEVNAGVACHEAKKLKEGQTSPSDEIEVAIDTCNSALVKCDEVMQEIIEVRKFLESILPK